MSRYPIIEFIIRFTSDQCSGHGVCECNHEDVRSVAKCSCEENYSGDVCQFEDIDGISVDYDNDGTPDAKDADDESSLMITMELRISSNLNMLDLTRVLVKC